MPGRPKLHQQFIPAYVVTLLLEQCRATAVLTVDQSRPGWLPHHGNTLGLGSSKWNMRRAKRFPPWQSFGASY